TLSGTGGAQPLAVVWEGAVSSVQSLALVNRALCLRLAARGHDLCVLPVEFPPNLGVPALPPDPVLTRRLRRRLARPAAAHVRHAWRPDFRPPAQGHWVIVQPWEFGSIPKAWVKPLCEQVDEVWAYTHYVRDCYVAAGVPPGRVHVVPLGVDA